MSKNILSKGEIITIINFKMVFIIHVYMRCIIVMGLMGLLLSHPGILPKTIRQTENDRSLIAQATIIDKSIIRYYRMRSELPPDISKETLKEMGIMQLADSKVWTYKNNGDSYVLTAKLSSKTYTSPYSNKSLPDVIRYPEGYQDND